MTEDDIERQGRIAALEVLVGALLLQTVGGDAAQLAALKEGLQSPSPREGASEEERALAAATQAHLNHLVDRAIFAATRPRLVK